MEHRQNKVASPTQPHIVVATDLGESSDAAVEMAAGLARGLGASLTVLSVFDPQQFAPVMEIFAVLDIWWDLVAVHESKTRELLDARVARLEKVDAKTAVVRDRNVAHGIRAFAESVNAELIVVGSRARSTASELFLGSVAHEVLRDADRPVLVVRPPVAAGD